MIYVLSGPDDFSVAQALDTLKAEMGDPATLAMSTTTLEGQNLSFDDLKVACDALPFMMGNRLVVVSGLIGRFESETKRRSTAKKTTAKPRKNAKQEEADRFAQYLAGGIPPTTVLVMTEGVISGENPILQALAGKATIRSFSLPKDAKLQDWVQKRVAEEGGSIAPAAVKLLASLVGSNLWVMANEVNKLVLYAGGRQIVEDDVREMVSDSQQATVFEMIDAIMLFRIESAQRLLQNLFRNGEAPVYLLFMISRQIQLIARAKEMKANRVSSRDMQMKLGMRSEWVLKKTLDQAARYSMPRLREVYRSLLDTDLAIKTGKYDPELALNILVAELCRKGGGIVPAGTRMR